MPRLWFLISVFVVSFLGSVVWMAPAELLVDRLGAVPLGPGRLQLSSPSGRIWDGRARWRWQQLSGELQWALDWRGLTPGLQLRLNERGDRSRLQGWFSGLSGTPGARDLEFDLPVAVMTEAFPRGGADGRVTGRIETLAWSGRGFSALSGDLRYGGGRVHWGSDGSAQLPPLDGRLYMEAGQAKAVVSGPEKQRLAEGSLGDGEVDFRVFRAWPQLLGVSGGGSPEDVVFELTRPVPGLAGGRQ